MRPRDPELADVWFGDGRYALVDLWHDYLGLRSRHLNIDVDTERSWPAPSSSSSRPGPSRCPGTRTPPLPQRPRCRLRHHDPPPPHRTKPMTTEPHRPGVIARLRSRQSGTPPDPSAASSDEPWSNTPPTATTAPSTCWTSPTQHRARRIGFGQGRTAALLLDQATTSSASTLSHHGQPRAATQPDPLPRRTSDPAPRRRHRRPPFAPTERRAAITVHTIYFMPDPTATFTDIARVLHPGGTLVIACRTADTPVPAWIDPDVYRMPTAAQIAMLTTTDTNTSTTTPSTPSTTASTSSPPTSPTPPARHDRHRHDHHRPTPPIRCGTPPESTTSNGPHHLPHSPAGSGPRCTASNSPTHPPH